MKDIEIYPSSWYYNACVHGFLEVLAWGLGDNGRDIIEEKFLQNDGSVRIPRDLMESIFNTENVPAPAGYELRKVPNDVKELKRIAWWWVELSSKVEDEDSKTVVELTSRSMLGTNRTFYPGLLPHNQTKISEVEFLNSWFSFSHNDGEIICSFCNMAYQPEENQAAKYYFFNNSISKYLGNTFDRFPNIHWDVQASITLCSSCRSYMIFFHMIYSKGIYINADSLLINWYLTNLVKSKNRTEDTYQTTFFHALRYNNQMRNMVGGWGLQNIEYIKMERDDITVQPITKKIATLLLMPEIGVILNRFRSALVWDLFFQERFDHFLTLAYKNLRYFITGENNNNDPEVLQNYSSSSAFLANNLVRLYYTIRKTEKKGGKEMGSVNFLEIQKVAGDAPLKITNNADKSVIFRLLELTRLNKRNDVYHLLLRTYIARGEKFPEHLTKVFSLNDEKLFQTGIYAYISGLAKKEEKYINIEGEN